MTLDGVMVPFDSWISFKLTMCNDRHYCSRKPYAKNIPSVQPLGNSALIFPHDFTHRRRFMVKF